ncbi:MAG: nucleoside hydrolase [Ketobacteraceae bacterium]|nr:nucleoside hydrolase [Ketobacteraceae bacterium]
MKVVFNHDAAIDEYIAGVLLSIMPGITLEQIIITNGDCVAGPAMNAGWRIQEYLGEPPDILSLARCRSWNQFPWEYRKDSVIINRIDCLRNIPVNPAWPEYPNTAKPRLPYHSLANGESGAFPLNGTRPAYPDGDQALENLLSQAVANNDPLTLVICCPLTLLSSVLKKSPGLAEGIRQLIWMGGAVDGEHGNLDPDTVPADIANPYAEWNVFWDPYAVAWIFEHTDFPITLFPLNVTNQAPLAPAFMDQLKHQASIAPLSRLAWEGYQLVLDQPFYRMWDVTTVAYLERPELFSKPEPRRLAIITDGFYQGTLIESDQGRALDVVLNIDNRAAFYHYLLDRLNR